MANALILLVRKADAVASTVPTTITLILCVRKKFAWTVTVYKKRAASGWQMP